MPNNRQKITRKHGKSSQVVTAPQGERPTLPQHCSLSKFSRKGIALLWKLVGKSTGYSICILLFVFEKRRTTAFQVIKALNKQACFAKPVKSIEIQYLSYI